MCEEVKGREPVAIPLGGSVGVGADGAVDRGDDELTLPKKTVINRVFTVVC
jgi:hypothetical protein